MPELSEQQLPTPVQGSLATRIDPGPRDFAALREVVRRGSRVGNERLDSDEHLNEVIPKPWGFEYRVYVDDFVDVWQLSIGSGHATSMHVHPRKLTYLLCLGGQGVTETLDGEHEVSTGTMLRIGGGAFHSTRSTGPGSLSLVEVEAPRNKFDLIRLRDGYAREGTAYETEHKKLENLAIRPVPYLPEARMRDRSPCGRFRFAVRAGMDVFYRPRAEDLFHVPLGLVGVVTGELDILAPALGDTTRPAVDEYYLSLADG